MWSLWTVIISLLADPDGIIPSPRSRQRLPLLLEISFTFGISRGSIYLIRGGKELPVDLMLYWADVEAVERMSGTVAYIINGNVNVIYT